jgi:hypothetical protein
MTDDQAALTLLQHGFERTAAKIKQMRDRNETDVQLMGFMLQMCENYDAFEIGASAQEAIEKLRAALIAMQIDLESVLFSMETAHLRATSAAQFAMAHAITLKQLLAHRPNLKGADDEKQ